MLVSSLDNVAHGDQCEPDAGMWGTTVDRPASASVFHYGQKDNFFFSLCNFSGTQFKNHNQPTQYIKQRLKKNIYIDVLPIQESNSFVSLMAAPCNTAAAISPFYKASMRACT